MAAAYTKEFLVDAWAYRYKVLGNDVYKTKTQFAADFYDKVGKDKFRTYCALDAEALRVYREFMKNV